MTTSEYLAFASQLRALGMTSLDTWADGRIRADFVAPAPPADEESETSGSFLVDTGVSETERDELLRLRRERDQAEEY